MRIKICPTCNIEFNSRVREGGRIQKYCSKKCYYSSLKSKFVCKTCHEVFYINKAKIFNGSLTGQYCSKSCYYKTRKGVRISRGTEFKKGIRVSKATEFKKGENMGENHPNWKGGISSEYDKIKRTDQYKYWRNRVYRRDSWTCQECGKHCEAKDIAAHHIKPFADFPELRFDINNGVTYCRGCHLSLHNKLRNEKKCAQAI